MNRLVASLVIAAAVRAGQAPATQAFEVAAVRPSAADSRGGGVTVTDARVDIRNATLFRVLLEAYQVDDHRLAAPDWLREQRFDIQATIPAGATRAHVPLMLQRLLTERFGLTMHIEKRPVPVYELEIASGGIKMREVEAVNELTKTFPAIAGSTSADTVEGEGDRRTRTIVTAGGLTVVTTRALWYQRMTDRRTWLLEATRMSMTDLVMLLSGMVDRPVVDKTALPGVYQFTTELPGLLATSGLARPAAVTAARDSTPAAAEPSGVSVFRAVETLGLRLESRRSPLDVVVVDTIARNPTAN
jgi:uncharacterized protein (TIGR03435 family)